MHELGTLLSQALPDHVPPGSRCGFRLIYADARAGRYIPKDLGACLLSGTDTHSESAAIGRKTLDEVRFVTGDLVDVAVYPEGYGGGRGVGGMGRGGRENGLGAQGFRLRGLATERGRGGGFGGSGVPSGEWRRGERVDETAGAPTGARKDMMVGGYGRRGRGRW